MVPSQTQACFLEGCHSSPEVTAASMGRMQRRCQTNSDAARSLRMSSASEEQTSFELELLPPETLPDHLHIARRYAIQYFFEQRFGSPPPSQWHGRGGACALLTHALGILPGQKHCIIQVLEDVWEARKMKKPYNPAGTCTRRGRKKLIRMYTPDATFILKVAEGCISTTQITLMLNNIRASKIPPQKMVSWTAVENFILNSPAVDRGRRQMKKSGSEDEEKGWSVGRLAQSRQFLFQFRMGLVFIEADPIAICSKSFIARPWSARATSSKRTSVTVRDQRRTLSRPQ